jgi:excinuclease ABC subunit A
MGPDGGDGGGRVVAEGTPEQVVKIPGSYTGAYLKPKLPAKKLPAALRNMKTTVTQ